MSQFLSDEYFVTSVVEMFCDLFFCVFYLFMPGYICEFNNVWFYKHIYINRISNIFLYDEDFVTSAIGVFCYMFSCVFKIIFSLINPC